MKNRKRQNFIPFQKKIWQWYYLYAPDLPWRKTHNPYHIYISEVMLQQTQIPRVLIKYPVFLKTFPTIQSLAASSLSRVLSAWHGMGYNRRGLYLQRSAKIIVRDHKGKIPKEISALDALPGIGPYSACAIRCFAYGICEPFIETNIRRAVIHTFFPKEEQVPDIKILEILNTLQPKTNMREWYWALMDYGRDALKHIPNPNRKSKHYAKQSRFEGSSRYVRAKIISYLLTNKKATEEELFLSLKQDHFLPDISHEDITRTLISLKKESLIKTVGIFFRIA